MLPRFLRDDEGAGPLGHLLHFSKHRVEKLGRSSQQVGDPSSGQLNLKQHAWPNNLTTNYSASVMLLRTGNV